MARIEKTDNSKCWWGCTMLPGLWKTVWEFSKRLNRDTTWPCKYTHRCVPKRQDNPSSCKTLLLNIHNSWWCHQGGDDLNANLLINGRCGLSMQRDLMGPFQGAKLWNAWHWGLRKTIMLSEISQSQRVAHRKIPPMWNFQSTEIYRDRQEISGCLGLGAGGGK